MQPLFDFCSDLRSRPVRPDLETAILVGQLRERFLRENHMERTPVKTERLHVSLHYAGDFKHLQTKLLYAASRAAEMVPMQAFEVTFRFIQSFEGAPLAAGRPSNPSGFWFANSS
jgi:2'-5' RNA ligase